jgi:hypothetical protein
MTESVWHRWLLGSLLILAVVGTTLLAPREALV